MSNESDYVSSAHSLFNHILISPNHEQLMYAVVYMEHFICIWSTHICIYMKQYIFIWSIAFTYKWDILFVVLTQTAPLKKGNVILAIIFFKGIATVDMVIWDDTKRVPRGSQLWAIQCMWSSSMNNSVHME